MSRIGTRSLLFGCHQFIIHPLMVAKAWFMLYGLPLDPRLWMAFFLHDIGYWGCENMDGVQGKQHPEAGAKIMGFLFGTEWEEFTLFHSRSCAQKYARPISRLCVADKLASAITPSWLYLILGSLSGEIEEYITNSSIPSQAKITRDKALWFHDLTIDSKRWVEAHKMTPLPGAPYAVYGSI